MKIGFSSVVVLLYFSMVASAVESPQELRNKLPKLSGQIVRIELLGDGRTLSLGSIEVIIENKGHSHGMKDPTPVLEFIRKHTPTPDMDH